MLVGPLFLHQHIQCGSDASWVAVFATTDEFNAAPMPVGFLTDKFTAAAMPAGFLSADKFNAAPMPVGFSACLSYVCST